MILTLRIEPKIRILMAFRKDLQRNSITNTKKRWTMDHLVSTSSFKKTNFDYIKTNGEKRSSKYSINGRVVLGCLFGFLCDLMFTTSILAI